jgi:hypothetical protein
MLPNPKYRGLYVVVRRESDGQDLFRWNIYQRKTPLGVRLTEGGFTSFHAAHEAGSKALAEERHDELRPSPGGTRGL